MGAITDIGQDERDRIELKALSELMPAYNRHLSHHLRNTLSALIFETELASQDIDDGNIEAVKNHLHRISLHCEHMESDLKGAGL